MSFQRKWGKQALVLALPPAWKASGSQRSVLSTFESGRGCCLSCFPEGHSSVLPFLQGGERHPLGVHAHVPEQRRCFLDWIHLCPVLLQTFPAPSYIPLFSSPSLPLLLSPLFSTDGDSFVRGSPTLQIVPGGAAARSGMVQVDDLLLQIDGQHVTSIPEAKALIVGDEGTAVELGIFRSGRGDVVCTIIRGGTAASPPPSGGAASGGSASADPGTWSVKELKQALSEAGVNAAGASEKSELIKLARDNKVPPPGTKRSSGTPPTGEPRTLDKRQNDT